ncbi:MAG TPA: 5-oxoprolinase subunit PxpA [Gemmatimonadaceae bacterium]|nr:5-oxoprolinase subunit PxpA [Gemmatimonadaceae bacterium]
MSDRIDLNCDMGESFGTYTLGADDAVFPFITSANVACGFHGGDPAVMRTSIARAMEHGVAVGAHPGFPDLIGFGRRNMDATPQEIYDMVVYQIGALAAFARAAGATLQHVKAHGALYNMAAVSAPYSEAIAHAVRDVDRALILFGLPGSHLIGEGRKAGLRTASEVFADRNYMPDGSLVSRRRPDAQVHDADDAVRRVIRMVREKTVRAIDGHDIAIEADTVCIHGDGPHAAEFAQRLRRDLEAAGISVRPLGRATA